VAQDAGLLASYQHIDRISINLKQLFGQILLK